VKKGGAPHINKDNSPDFCCLSSADGTHIERHATWLLVKTQTVTQSVLWRDHDMRQIFVHIAFYAFYRQFTET
jgi:hypothetical protein